MVIRSKIVYTFVESQNWAGKKMITLCTSGGSGIGRSGSDLSKFAKGVDFRGGKDFTRGSGADVKKYIYRRFVEIRRFPATQTLPHPGNSSSSCPCVSASPSRRKPSVVNLR
nr:flavodoxin [Treponema sp.]